MECSIPIIRYSEFSDELHQKALKARIPLDGALELTFRCNLKCIHCYCNLSADDIKAKSEELTTREVFCILDQLKEAGCLFLLFTGGEPLLRPDLLDIYDYAKKNGFIITIFTNGTMVTQSLVNYLEKQRPFTVEISLYGITEKTYERITGVQGSFNKCLKGIELLKGAGVSLKLKTMLLSINQEELKEIKAFVRNLGLSFSFDPILNPRLDGNRSPYAYRVSPEEVVRWDIEDDARKEAWKKYLGTYSTNYENEQIFTCAAGKSSFVINPYGNLSPCMMVRSPAYNLRNGNLKKGWSEFIPKVIATKYSAFNKCRTCSDYVFCDRCPGWSFLETGNKEAPLEYVCQIARMRSHIFRKGGIYEKEDIPQTQDI
ncbi:MAG: radical SAM protein [Candidatus Zixiibacteriota bacterium]